MLGWGLSIAKAELILINFINAKEKIISEHGLALALFEKLSLLHLRFRVLAPFTLQGAAGLVLFHRPEPEGFGHEELPELLPKLDLCRHGHLLILVRLLAELRTLSLSFSLQGLS